MKVLSANRRPEKGCAVTIGAFDGVHVGHRVLVDRTRKRADEFGIASAVVTFDRHPAAVVRPDSAPHLLTDLDQKLELLEATGIDYTLVLSFDAARAAEPAETFVKDTLVDRLGARAVVVGYDFHFGKARQGNVAFLRDMGETHDFEVDEVHVVEAGAVTVSSTEIRRLLSNGDVASAAELLGRSHEVRGLVLMGDGRGRELGYPTANVHVPHEVMLPANGVYAGEYVFSDGTVAPAAISLGTRPTFHTDGADLLEAHILDFDGDLYGRHARVRFAKRLRGQERFDSVDELIAQMATDVAAVRGMSR